jgi:hypothetical protein
VMTCRINKIMVINCRVKKAIIVTAAAVDDIHAIYESVALCNTS